MSVYLLPTPNYLLFARGQLLRLSQPSPLLSFPAASCFGLIVLVGPRNYSLFAGVAFHYYNLPCVRPKMTSPGQIPECHSAAAIGGAWKANTKLASNLSLGLSFQPH